MMKIPRFSIVDMDNKKSNKVGIIDHQDGRFIVIVNEIVDKETTQSIAEDIISVIEENISDGNGD